MKKFFLFRRFFFLFFCFLSFFCVRESFSPLLFHYFFYFFLLLFAWLSSKDRGGTTENKKRRRNIIIQYVEIINSKIRFIKRERKKNIVYESYLYVKRRWKLLKFSFFLAQAKRKEGGVFGFSEQTQEQLKTSESSDPWKCSEIVVNLKNFQNALGDFRTGDRKRQKTNKNQLHCK